MPTQATANHDDNAQASISNNGDLEPASTVEDANNDQAKPNTDDDGVDLDEMADESGTSFRQQELRDDDGVSIDLAEPTFDENRSLEDEQDDDENASMDLGEPTIDEDPNLEYGQEDGDDVSVDLAATPTGVERRLDYEEEDNDDASINLADVIDVGGGSLENGAENNTDQDADDNSVITRTGPVQASGSGQMAITIDDGDFVPEKTSLPTQPPPSINERKRKR